MPFSYFTELFLLDPGIVNISKNNFCGVSSYVYQQGITSIAIYCFRDKVYMKTQLTPAQAMRYCRQVLLPEFDLHGQESLLNARILQIGAGGLGCASAQYLVAAGVGKLTLVDDDKVDLTNLQRQILHTEQDIKRPKVESAKQTLQQLNSEVEIQGISKRLDAKELARLLPEVDIVIDCCDNLETRQLINQSCYQANKPLVSGAAIRFEGQITSFIPGSQQACYQCFSRFFGEQELSCVEAGIMSPVVGIIGAMQALEAIKLLSGIGQDLAGRLLIFDGLSMQWQEFKLVRDPNCAVCK